MSEKIDFVILWVDGSDKKWLEEKNKYSKEKIDTTNSVNRYRDMKILKYWFRGVEKFAPWVNKIHFVTWGHVPEWLNLKNEKLNVVKHEDFIPKKYLPTFSSHVIELNMHRIKGLSDKFVYFNDDQVIINSISSDYFFSGDLPRDIWRDNIPYYDKDTDENFAHILLNDTMLISRNFNKRETINKNKNKVFNKLYGRRNLRFLLLQKWPYMAGFDNPHTAAPFLKKTFEDVWEKEYFVLDRTCNSKFRTNNDVNQYVMQLWQIYKGEFEPKSYKKFGKFFNLSNDNAELFDCIDNQREEQICINDSDTTIEYEKACLELVSHFQKILPEKSSFEK